MVPLSFGPGGFTFMLRALFILGAALLPLAVAIALVLCGYYVFVT